VDNVSDKEEADEDDDYEYNEDDEFDPADDCTRGDEAPFKMLHQDHIYEMLENTVRNAAGLLNLSFDEAYMLLVHFNWNEDKVVEEFFADSAKVKREAGIDLYDTSAISQTEGAGEKQGGITCGICYDDTPFVGFHLGCQHVYCRDCYSMYAQSKLSEGPGCVRTPCPSPKCTQRLTPGCWKSLLAEVGVEEYSKLVVRNYIETNKKYRYCPGVSCSYVAESVGPTLVLCPGCSTSFCFSCGKDDHRPCSCDAVAKWEEKNRNESESLRWIQVNTKTCPSCKVAVEKNGGCNHMSCSHCRHQFCWICSGNWVGHTSCNRFVPPSEEEAHKRAKHEMERYMHFFTRFQNHEIGLKFAVKQRAQLQLRLDNISTADSMHFLLDAADQVIQCRRVLMYTYVMGFAMADSADNKLLFERHQEMLEESTERLHGFLESKDHRQLDRAQVINTTEGVERFRKSLLADIHDDDTMTVDAKPIEKEASGKLGTLP